MFTGLVGELGIIEGIERYDGVTLATIRAPATAASLSEGDSVAVDGVCLTATRAGRSTFDVEMVSETVARTTLGSVEPDHRVNLELPLQAGARLGGHIVQGHVDGVGTVVDVSVERGDATLVVEAPSGLGRYIVEKGSVAVNGVSLTVSKRERDTFSVALIPKTLAVTNLGSLGVSDLVNLEVDIMGKYVEQMLGAGP